MVSCSITHLHYDDGAPREGERGWGGGPVAPFQKKTTKKHRQQLALEEEQERSFFFWLFFSPTPDPTASREIKPLKESPQRQLIFYLLNFFFFTSYHQVVV